MPGLGFSHGGSVSPTQAQGGQLSRVLLTGHFFKAVYLEETLQKYADLGAGLGELSG